MVFLICKESKMKTKLLLIAIIIAIFGCYKATDEVQHEKAIYTETPASIVLDEFEYLDKGSRAGITLVTTFFRTSGTTDNWYSHLGRAARVFEIINLNQIDSIQYVRTSPGVGRFGRPGEYIRMANYDVSIFYKDSTITRNNYLVRYTQDNFTDTNVSGGLIHPLAKTKITAFTRNDRDRVMYQLPYAPQRSTWRYKYIRSTDGVFIDEEFKEPENLNQNFWQPLNIY